MMGLDLDFSKIVGRSKRQSNANHQSNFIDKEDVRPSELNASSSVRNVPLNFTKKNQVQ